ncbi:unnamed protein product [Peniophora sp. CBMAI 1063]|nr:unnamed protein product [Peniophora sp. CBMAI 1063]
MTPHEEARHYHEHVYYNAPPPPHHTPSHDGSLTHEALAGAAGFAAMDAYESHLRATGQPVSHPVMKEILAAAAAAEVEKLVGTKGLPVSRPPQGKEDGRGASVMDRLKRFMGMVVVARNTARITLRHQYMVRDIGSCEVHGRWCHFKLKS